MTATAGDHGTAAVKPTPPHHDAARTVAVLHPKFRSARDQALAELFNSQRTVLVTGPSGTGKTLLLHELARVLRSVGWHTTLDFKTDSPLPSAGPARPDAIPGVVLVDSAGPISPSQVQRILKLKNVAVVIAGPDSLAASYPASPCIQLAPLSAHESDAFVQAWLGQAGHPPERLSRDALVRIIELARGVPRSLSAMLSDSMWRASTRLSATVSTADVEDAAAGLGLAATSPAPSTAVQGLASGAAPEPDRAPDPDPPLPARDQGLTWTPDSPPARVAPSLANAAAAGILCGIGIGLMGLMLQDLLPGALRGDQAREAPARLSAPVDANTRDTDLPAARTPAPAAPPQPADDADRHREDSAPP